MRLCDATLAAKKEVKPYTLRWNEQESLMVTTLFDVLLQSGADGFRTLTGSLIR